MGLFGKKGQPEQQQRSSSVGGDDKVPVRDPGLDPQDPRQLLFGLLHGSGISFVLNARVDVGRTLQEAVRLAPILARSSHLGRGFLRMDADPQTVWTAVEGPSGSAVIVFGSPESNTDLLFQTVFKPFEQAQHPFSCDMVFSGSTSPNLAAIINGADVAPAWEVDPLHHIADPAEFPTLPASIRRAACGWERIGLDLYKRQLQDIDGDTVDVFLGLNEGRPDLITTIGGIAPDGDLDRFEPLTARGPYSLERWDAAVVFVRSVPLGIEESQLMQLSQRLVDDLAAGLAELGKVNAPSLPVKTTVTSLWDRLETVPAGAAPTRQIDWPSSTADYTVIERVRESVPEGTSTFESLDLLAQQLRAQRGSGFEHAWRGAGDALLSPSWLTFQSAAFDPESGRIVATGHLNHEVWDLSPAHDLGAIDGRNGFSFSEQGHAGGVVWPSSSLYVGSTRTGILVPLDATLNVLTVDLHAVTGTIAALAHLGGSTAAVFLFDPSGERHLLTVVEDISGNEPIRFSGDGEWLLISGSQASTLVEVATGRWLRLDVGNAAWWPLGDSSLLTVTHDNGTATPQIFSLESNSYTRTYPQITLDVPLLSSFPYTWFPAVSPDGREILVQTPAGVTTEYQSEHGVGGHLARVTLDDGQGRLVGEVFLNSERTLERDVREARWTGRPPSHHIRLVPTLELNPPVTEHAYLDPGRWADEAERVLVLTLNKAIELTKEGKDISHLVPEILAALIPIGCNGDIWERQSEWLVGLQQSTNNLVANGTITGNAATAWRRYGSAIAAIQAGRLELIDPVTAAWS
ncbi:hypothetical protein EV651_1238 [Kribbella sp. VKM Ac-2571]|uniref:hypothetical protein n=1 Tax=Kribbella sp. VKM Ac-2571 TaxID=2512222 RepID=UPI00105E9B87|nr:hypothetical protein [Kribbella sp. VKM Ac-2571]TDO48242.1 hypothetical protein EV651_1238 [Kribbella sp. VKM Ac-2571]